MRRCRRKNRDGWKRVNFFESLSDHSLAVNDYFLLSSLLSKGILYNLKQPKAWSKIEALRQTYSPFTCQLCSNDVNFEHVFINAHLGLTKKIIAAPFYGFRRIGGRWEMNEISISLVSCFLVYERMYQSCLVSKIHTFAPPINSNAPIALCDGLIKT